MVSCISCVTFAWTCVFFYVMLKVFTNLEFTLNQGRGGGEVCGGAGLFVDLKGEQQMGRGTNGLEVSQQVLQVCEGPE